MDMPKVDTCNASQCAFNQGNKCHALAVTIGNFDAPECDTFLNNGTKGGEAREIAGVGACKMDDCQHNKELYCTAKTIHVEQTADGPMCTTYSPVGAKVQA